MVQYAKNDNVVVLLPSPKGIRTVVIQECMRIPISAMTYLCGRLFRAVALRFFLPGFLCLVRGLHETLLRMYPMAQVPISWPVQYAENQAFPGHNCAIFEPQVPTCQKRVQLRFETWFQVQEQAAVWPMVM